MTRRLGPKLIGPGHTEFSLWAPDAMHVAVGVEGETRRLDMRRGEDDMWLRRADLGAGAAYHYLVDGGEKLPDPASHAQAGDIHGPSLVVDHDFPWHHNNWRGRPWAETVIYELHAGLYGGFAGVAEQLPRLAEIGFTAIELMPIADFPGKRNWGYDGVLMFAPASAYGTPAELKSLIDTAHGLGLQVFLDVVYNHFGPDGNYLGQYASAFFQADTHTPWGNAIDFARPQVRDFFIGNTFHWLETYRFDGLRFDAVHAIGDKDFLLEMAAAIRAKFPHRHIHLMLENENNDSSLLNETPEGDKYTAQWADDWHHAAHVLLTQENEGYYADFQNPAEKLSRCLAEGFAYQGDPSPHRGNAPRGTPSAQLPPAAFVICLQNHDQIGNRALGERLRTLAHPEALKAAIALLLLTPQIPLVFMGEEYGETRPFLYFTDHHGELAQAVTEGRRREFAHFAAFADPEKQALIPDPNAPETFAACIPQVADNAWTELYRTCLALRREYVVPGIPLCKSLGASALSAHAVRAAWAVGDATTLTLAANFGEAPVPLEPPPGRLVYGPDRKSGMLPGLSTSFWVER